MLILRRVLDARSLCGQPPADCGTAYPRRARDRHGEATADHSLFRDFGNCKAVLTWPNSD